MNEIYSLKIVSCFIPNETTNKVGQKLCRRPIKGLPKTLSWMKFRYHMELHSTRCAKWSTIVIKQDSRNGLTRLHKGNQLGHVRPALNTGVFDAPVFMCVSNTQNKPPRKRNSSQRSQMCDHNETTRRWLFLGGCCESTAIIPGHT